MKKPALAVLVAAAVSFLGVPESSALSFSLNCIITNGGCTPSATYGTVTYTDNGDSVDLTVQLLGGQKILNVYLNYDDSKFSNSSALLLANKTLDIDENDIAFPPYDAGFDLAIPATGNVNEFGTYSDTFSLSLTNLDPADFNFKDATNLLFAGVHIGNCSAAPASTASCDPGLTGEGSIKVGAIDPGLAPVPEPATLLLLGTSMAGMGWIARRRSRS